MKKFLSLVLALVMTMSLVTISAGAKDFADNSKINYKEAVDVVSELEIVDGYKDGSFNPSATLTRGAAAKIICNLILGPTTAKALNADSAPFKDVPTNHEFAGYIAYCAQQKIISGYADGTFRPAGTLTGYAFMKMLLGALGYDATIEQFVGPNWSVQVGKTALGVGLDKGNDEFVGTQAVTREEACLYAFNTLKATMVEYDSKITANINGAEITIGNSKAEEVAQTGYTDRYDNGSNSLNQTLQFSERFFPKLRVNNDNGLDTGTDDFMRPANVWTYKSDEIGTYALTADATYYKAAEYADIYKDAGLSGSTNFKVYIDGVVAEDFANGDYTGSFDLNGDGDNTDSNETDSCVRINKGNEDDDIGYKGTLLQVYKDSRVITMVNTYIGQVVGVEKATSKRDAYVEVSTVGDSSKYNNDKGSILEKDTYDTEEFDVDDIVIFTYSLSAKGIKSMVAAESVEGKVVSFTTDKKFTMDDKTYEYGKYATATFGSSDIGTDAKVYLDANGYALYYDEGAENLKNYALVLSADTDQDHSGYGSNTSGWARLLYTDGTIKIVDTDKVYGDANSDSTPVDVDLEGFWVTYKTNSKNQVVLTKPTGTHNSAYTGSAAVSTDNGKSAATLGGNSIKINSTTTIVMKDGKDYKVYEGVKSIPTISGSDCSYAYFTKKGDSFAKVVFIDVGATTNVSYGNKKTIFLNANSSSKLVETANDQYYVFDAVVDGKIVEDGVMLDATDSSTLAVIAALTTSKKYDNVLLDTYGESGGMYTGKIGDMVSGTSGGVLSVGDKVEKVTGETIAFTSGAYVIAKDCTFVRVDANNNMKDVTRSGLRTGQVVDPTDPLDTSYYAWVGYTLNSDMEITGVYWQVN